MRSKCEREIYKAILLSVSFATVIFGLASALFLTIYPDFSIFVEVASLVISTVLGVVLFIGVVKSWQTCITAFFISYTSLLILATMMLAYMSHSLVKKEEYVIISTLVARWILLPIAIWAGIGANETNLEPAGKVEAQKKEIIVKWEKDSSFK